MTDELAGKVLDAYKTSPLLTGLLLINIMLMVGFGWWEVKRAERTEVFIREQLNKQDTLQERLLQMAKDCTKGAF